MVWTHGGAEAAKRTSGADAFIQSMCGETPKRGLRKKTGRNDNFARRRPTEPTPNPALSNALPGVGSFKHVFVRRANRGTRTRRRSGGQRPPR